MSHRHLRTERDLTALAAAFSDGRAARAVPERLECLAAWHRMVIEAEKANDGQPNAYTVASVAYSAAIDRMLTAGVSASEGKYTFSPCMGPDAPVTSTPAT